MCVTVCVTVFVTVCVCVCVCAAGGPGVVCLSLISLGVQTCGEDDVTTWRTQDCSPSVVKTTPDPFGWYQKPGTEYTSTHSTHICINTHTLS